MKVKAGVFTILLILLISIAIFANIEVSGMDNGLSHSLETLYGNENVLDGLKIGLYYDAPGGLLFRSDLIFSKDGSFKEKTKTSPSEDDSVRTTSRYNDPDAISNDDKVLAKWVHCHTGKKVISKRYGSHGFFYIGTDTDSVSDYYDNDIEYSIWKDIALPDMNGVFAVDYTGSADSPYLQTPNSETIRSIAEFKDDCVIKKMGFSKDGRFLEILYFEEGLLKIKVLDIESEELTDETVLFDEEATLNNLNVYFPGSLYTDETEEKNCDYTIVSCDKGFCLIDNSRKMPEITINAEFGEEDGPNVLGTWLVKDEFRHRRVCYDGERFTSVQRVVKTDPVYNEFKGISILVYGKDGLEYAGIVDSNLYERQTENLIDAYAREYADSDISGRYAQLNESTGGFDIEDMEVEEVDENEECWYYTGDIWGFYSIYSLKY